MQSFKKSRALQIEITNEENNRKFQETGLSEEEKNGIIFQFENKLKDKKHQFCKRCKCVSITMIMSKDASIFQSCNSKNEN